jgi:hypothetical protein
MLKWSVILLAMLLLFSLVISHASALDITNTTTGETYIKWCWGDGTPPYQISLDGSELINVGSNVCHIYGSLESDSLHSIRVVDSLSDEIYSEENTDEDLFTSDMSWFVYATGGLVLASMVFPPFVYASWITGTIAIGYSLSSGRGFLFALLVGFLFICGFLRLVIAQRNLHG